LNIGDFDVIFHAENFQQIDERFSVSRRDHDVGLEVSIAWLGPEIVNIASLVVELHQDVEGSLVFGCHFVHLVPVINRLFLFQTDNYVFKL
jgi:hypothetical protein